MNMTVTERMRALRAALEADASAGAGVSTAALEAAGHLDRALMTVPPAETAMHVLRAINALPVGSPARSEGRRIVAMLDAAASRHG